MIRVVLWLIQKLKTTKYTKIHEKKFVSARVPVHCRFAFRSGRLLINIRPRLDDINATVHYSPLDVLLALAAKGTLDVHRGLRERTRLQIGQHTLLSICALVACLAKIAILIESERALLLRERHHDDRVRLRIK